MDARSATLDRLFAAFNHHDADAVMACFSDEAVFFTAAGPTAAGRRIEGLESLRAAFVAVWTEMPDVQWTVHRSRVFADGGMTEWLFAGTRADGARVEAEGLDLFTFAGDLVASKSAFRKDRPAIQAAVPSRAADNASAA